MKKARNIIVLLMLLGAASLAEAQIMVSSTTASTQRIYEKSGREKGLVIRPELNLGTCDFVDGIYGGSATLVYQFSPYIEAGIGGGVTVNVSEMFLDRQYWSFLPVFGDFRTYFHDGKYSPYIDLKLGYYLHTGHTYPSPDGYGTSYEPSLAGIMFRGSFGVQIKNYDLALSYEGAKKEYWVKLYYKSIVCLHFAYNFQFKKK